MMSPSLEFLEAAVPPEAAGERLDRFLPHRFPEVSRSRFQTLIANGCVDVEGAPATEARRKMKAGDRVTVRLPPPVAAEPEPEAIALDVVYEDEALIVIDKPAGLVVHPAAGHHSGTLVNALLAHCGDSLSGIGGVKRPGIVHRLDKDTSGLLVVAKTDQAHKGLSEQFAAHGRDGRLERAYLAVCWGAFERQRGTVDAPIGRHATAREKMSVTRHTHARAAITHYEVEQSFGSPPVASLLTCRLETGRTHQIRVHMAHIGHPLLGDETYGRGFKTAIHKLPETAQTALKALGRQALHAAVLGFEHPVTGEPMSFASDPPPDLSALIDTLASSS
ncbi:RluA family pseudouridine synthase [Nordella sp. HKS 07]|uniref:RluA family pseudouridine synthase n=1 Tax=Nordella sp. HKS 07 TaxID=2712222 RepID=UPI0013E16B1F|nr:RluA family pseudouridine synthase [Nordella sp. HKS 07]QIG46840.1 RluA family pseudouridine synthase [Nordella sp. HKS 07]